MSNPPNTRTAARGTLLTDGGEESETSSEDDQPDDGGDGENDPASGDSASAPDVEGGTSVLYLDLEGVFLDLLGLEVDLEEVELQIDAMRGSGNLLGNLLSGVAGLLDTGPGEVLQGLVDRVVEGLIGDFDWDSIPGSDIKSSLRGVVDDLPVEELVSQVVTEVVSQLLDGSGDASGSAQDATGADESGVEA